ncbi:sigma-70 family RNA polymerase sigma factor [Corynebacterium guangdongense]|uniref:RNA polymerase sigma-70 factor (ECF subfamily) n=1 Tax=Corynebacterium guangdongense TaxID=1783348 RepID=A0ABU2A081_9CORY|nr:sigma-70 family RNA polymerase sigma factor [Corynebacterium guangdongense]MDR7330584.1 RNA polymerase sigma-70 factor (ECF subfamily) [Corynebacterium guangdongense]WJZ19138.1 ECF RNA polymerase sigma factor SigM [Corynebacterium guangdongense]
MPGPEQRLDQPSTIAERTAADARERARDRLTAVVGNSRFEGDGFNDPARPPEPGRFAALAHLGKTERSDEQLVSDFLAGDATAFSTIVERHRARLLWVARRYTRGNEADAEDVVQEALFKASRKLGSFRQESSLSTWLHRMVMNGGYDFSHHRFRREMPTLNDDTVDAEHDYRLAHDPHAAHSESMAVREALNSLHPDQRRALLAVDAFGYSVKDVAREEGVKPGTIKSRRARARTAFSEALARVGASP